jgi:hypothetical protein
MLCLINKYYVKYYGKQISFNPNSLNENVIKESTLDNNNNNLLDTDSKFACVLDSPKDLIDNPGLFMLDEPVLETLYEQLEDMYDILDKMVGASKNICALMMDHMDEILYNQYSEGIDDIEKYRLFLMFIYEKGYDFTTDVYLKKKIQKCLKKEVIDIKEERITEFEMPYYD